MTELNNLQLEYRVLKSWNGGFKAEIHITNTGTSSIADWDLLFDFAPQIENIWRAEIITHENGSYRISGISYTDTLAAGETLTIGFKASGDSSAQPVFHLLAPAGANPLPARTAA